MLLILSLLVTGLLVSCTEKGEEEETTRDSGVSQTSRIQLVTDGACDYVIVFPDLTSPDLMSAVVNFKTQIRKLTGISLDAVSESTAREDGTTEKMILVGRTSFQQSEDAKARLAGTCSDEYLITTDGDIVVLASNYDTALLAAVSACADSAVTYDSAGGTLSVTETYFSGTEPLPVGFNPSSELLADYSIIYASSIVGLDSLAEDLQAYIKTATGYELPIYKDNAISEGPYEILLGYTNRSLSATCYAESSNIMRYEMTVKNGVLQMVIGGPYSGMKCVEKFNTRVLGRMETLTSGTYYTEELATDTQPLTEGADVRIMSSNVLAWYWGENVYSNIFPVATRCEIYAGVLLRFQPDVVGVQETDDPWMAALPYYLSVMEEKENVTYSHIQKKVSLNGTSVTNYSSMLYRSDLYTLDESGCEIFSANYMTTFTQRVGTYAKLTGKTDSSIQMVVINTHWAHESEERVQACVTEEAALVEKMKTKYPNVPIFCTGDFNSHKYDGTYLTQFANTIEGTISSKAALLKGVLITTGGCHTFSPEKISDTTMRSLNSAFIDHIITTGGYANVLRHDTIRTNGCHVMSDHCPIYADFSLKESS